MKDIRYYINLIEARSHPDSNPKHKTADIFIKYIEKYGSSAYVHFNKIEKVGFNFLRNSNIASGTPFGVFAMPIEIAASYRLENLTARYQLRYANILIARPDAKILNLDTVSLDVMKELSQQAVKFYKKKTKDNWYVNIDKLPSVREHYQQITELLSSYSARRKRRDSIVINSFFRNNGYDAILDTNQIINDNSGQIVFLTPSSYEVLETIPIRF